MSKINCKLSTNVPKRKTCVLTDYDDENNPEHFKCNTKKSKKSKKPPVGKKEDWTKKFKKSTAASKKKIINRNKHAGGANARDKHDTDAGDNVLRNFNESSRILGNYEQIPLDEKKIIRLDEGGNSFLIITAQFFETQNMDQYDYFRVWVSGAFNIIYETVNNLDQIHALRVEIVDEGKRDELIERFKEDARLYVRLSTLKIIPKIHSIFFARTSEEGQTALCSILDLAEGGSVSEYLQSEDYYKLGREQVKVFATKLRTLYKRLTDNHIVCTDVKTDNAVVRFEQNKIPTPYLIDVDTDFCKIHFDVTLQTINDLLKEKNLGIDGVSEKELLDIYFHYMILQVACYVESYDTGVFEGRREHVHKDHNAFVDAFLGEEMSPRMYTVLSVLIVLEIGNGKRKPMTFFDGYFYLLREEKLFREHLRKNPDEYLRIAFMYAKEGEEKTKSYAIKNYKRFF